MKLATPLLALCTFQLFLFACGGASRSAAPSEVGQEISAALEAVVADPQDLDAVLRLGVLYYKSGEYAIAGPLLRKVYGERESDPVALSYLALTLEATGRLEPALQLIERALPSVTHRYFEEWLLGKRELLQRKLSRERLATLIRSGPEPGSESGVANRLLLFPFEYLGSDDKFLPLRKGLTEMMIYDLRLAGAFEVVDRFESELLGSLLRGGRLTMADSARTARIAGVAGVQTIIVCTFDIWRDSQFAMDLGFWRDGHARMPSTMSHVGDLSGLLEIEARAVLAFLRSLGVSPDDETRRMIERVPTRNMNAFLVYSAGLMKEDAGDFAGSVIYFEKAYEMDNGFHECELKIMENRRLALASSDPPLVVPPEDEVDELHGIGRN